MQVTRRQFFKVCAGGLGASSMAMLGFAPNDALAEVREFKLTRSTETRNTCPYCSGHFTCMEPVAWSVGHCTDVIHRVHRCRARLCQT